MTISGLPALPSDVIIAAVSLVSADALSLPGSQAGQQWGLFLDGEPVVVADNLLSFDFRQDYRISDYPVEEGAFESYNKVATPFDVRLQFSSGGSIVNRQALVNSVDAIIGSTDLFDAVTPEKIFASINLVHQSIRRISHQGLGLVVVDVYCRQVRVTATQQFVNNQQTVSAPSSGDANSATQPAASPINQPQSPSASPQVSDGAVQPVTPAPGQISVFENAMPLP